MRGLCSVIFLLSLIVLTTSTAVLQLQGDDFQTHLESHSPIVVNFCLVSHHSTPLQSMLPNKSNSHVQPWYEPCQNLEPEFEAAAEVLQKRDIKCISIDCSVDNTTCIANQITSYPTIRIFHGPEKFTRYRHERKAANIISYMIRGSLPLVSEVNESNLKEILSMGTSALIAYIEENDQESRAIFTSFAESHQNEFIYGITSDLQLASSDAQETPAIILYNPLDQVTPIFQGAFEVTKLQDFTKKHATPLIGTFSLETYYAYTETRLPLLHVFISSPSNPSHATLLSLLQPIASKHTGRLNVATIDANKYAFFAKALNLAPDKFPAFVIEDTVSGDAVPFDQDEEITGEKLGVFVERHFRERWNGDVPVVTAGPKRDEL
ncbi:Thioredoxin-like domain containing protein [Hyaloscypha variabilis]